MHRERHDEILALIERLKSEINVAESLSLDHTIRLIRIAVLDLQTIVHAISDDELQEIAKRVEKGVLRDPAAVFNRTTS